MRASGKYIDYWKKVFDQSQIDAYCMWTLERINACRRIGDEEGVDHYSNPNWGWLHFMRPEQKEELAYLSWRELAKEQGRPYGIDPRCETCGLRLVPNVEMAPTLSHTPDIGQSTIDCRAYIVRCHTGGA